MLRTRMQHSPAPASIPANAKAVDTACTYLPYLRLYISTIMPLYRLPLTRIDPFIPRYTLFLPFHSGHLHSLRYSYLPI